MNTKHAPKYRLKEKEEEQIAELRRRLADAEETLNAIREGEVDAIVVSGKGGQRVFSLTGAEQVYRLIVETMKEAALTVAFDGTILFCNAQFGEFLGLPQEKILGHVLHEFVAPEQHPAISELIAHSATRGVKERLVFVSKVRPPVPAHVSANVLDQDDGVSICIVATDLSELETSQEALRRIEWLLTSRRSLQVGREKAYVPPYGDLVQLNTGRLILDSVGEPVLADVVGDYLDLLDTSAAVHEKNGDYALSVFSSGWCQTMDAASRRLCGTEDNSEALTGGRWLCHDSCWSKASKTSIERGQPVDIECDGGIRLYAVPIRAAGELVGSINFGYGDPPQDPARLRELSAKFGIGFEELRRSAEAYRSRPPFIVEVAKRRLEVSSRLIGEIIERRQTEERLKAVNRRLKMISECNQALARASSESELLENACRNIVETGGYPLAWVTLVDAAEPGGWRLAASSGGESVLVAEKLCSGVESGEELISAAIRTGQPVVCADLGSHPDARAYTDGPLPFRYASAIAMPLMTDGRCLGALAVYASEPDAFDAEEVKILEELAGDLAYGVGVQRMRAEREQALQAVRMSEDKFRYVFDYSLIGKSITLPSGEMQVNRAFCQMLGYSEQEFSRRKWQEITHPEDIEACQKVIDSILSGATDSARFVKRYIHRNGCVVWADVWTAVRRDQKGNPLYLMTSVRDITENKRAEEEIRRLNESLEQRIQDRTQQLTAANKELECFSYSVSHDLRAPLRHMVGFINLLNRAAGHSLNDKSRHYMKQVADSARQMDCLIDDLLAFSLTSRAEMRQQLLDGQALLEEALGNLRNETTGRDIVWRKRSLPQLQGDPAMLRQVFINLLSNAIKYTRPRKTAEIEIGCASETADEVVIYVRDNGVGFDMQYAEELFGVFQRLHHAEEFEGTGIGLANVRRTIARHGGRTWAEGEVDRGATFYFSLPKMKQSTA